LHLQKGGGKVDKGFPISHEYWVVTEVRYNWALLGETEKFVVGCGKRVREIDVSTTHLSLRIAGVQGEQVEICAVDFAHENAGDPNEGELRCERVIVGASGSTLVRFSRDQEGAIFV